jgi:hypothetical protein
MMRNLGGEFAKLCATCAIDKNVEFMFFRDSTLRSILVFYWFEKTTFF